MKDRVKIGNGKSSKLMIPADYTASTVAELIADLKAGTFFVDITANNSDGSDAGVTEIGTAINKANCLSDATAEGFGFATADNPTINDVLARIGADYITGTLTAGQTTLTLTNARIKTTSNIDIYCDSLTDGTPVVPIGQVASTGSLVLTFDTYEENIDVKVRVM